MYHVELRHFPHNMSRFNIDGAQLRAIVEPWARGEQIEFGEHRWSPEQARLTILEGPRIPPAQLTMGRGWRAAERQGKDVTEAVLAAARRAVAAAASGAGPAAAGTVGAGMPVAPGSAGAAPAVDAFALGMQMAALLGPDAMRLLDAWRAAAVSSPGLAPSETLARAEEALRAGDVAEG
jgi:hypothetical protein